MYMCSVELFDPTLQIMTVYPPLWAYGDRHWSGTETGAGAGAGAGAVTGAETGAGSGAGDSHSETVVDPNPNRGTCDRDRDRDPMEPSYGDTYARRYWCLFMLTVSSALQTMTWMTYATTTDQIQERYGWSSFQINLLTTWGPAFYVPVSLMVSWYDTRFGVRAGVTLCMTLTCLGSILRIVAPPDSSWALPLAHIGSIVNAIGAPFTKATPSSLSMIWFPSHQRTLSTAIGSIAPYMGIAVGFLLTLTVKTGADLSKLLLIEAIITSIFLLLQLCDHAFPSIPPSPPSYSQYLITVSNQVDTVASGTGTGTVSGTDTDHDIPLSWCGKCRYKLGVWIQKTITILSNTSFVLIVCVYGLSNGVYTGWSGILYLILKPLNFTQDQAAWLGFGLTSTGIIGACMISPIITFLYPQKHTHKQQQQQQQQAVTPNPDGSNDYFPSTCSPSLPLPVDPTITIPCHVDDPHPCHDEGISPRVHDYHQSCLTSTHQLDDTVSSNAHFIDTNEMDRVQRNPVLSNQHIASDAEETISSLPTSSSSSALSPSSSSSSSKKMSCCQCLLSRAHGRSRPSNRNILLFLFATTSLLCLFYTLQANQYYNIHMSILYILILAASMLVCASIPLSYESCVDSLYPGSATLANAISSSSSHIIQSVFILSQNVFSSYVLNWILTISMIFSFILLYIWKEKLTRQTLDSTHYINNTKHTHRHRHTTPNITHHTNTYYSSDGFE